jgi:hypothetical protein
LKEMALFTFWLAAAIRLICASNRVETANPAASSSGDMLLDPEDNRDSDFANMLLDPPSIRALVWEDVFVLITILFLP